MKAFRNLCFETQGYINELSGGDLPSHRSGVITAFEILHGIGSLHKNPASILWNLSHRNHGEYLFVLPNREIDLAPRPTLTRNDNPYRGLEAYERHDAQRRTRLIEKITAKVLQNPLTVVLGASGTGKSSLVKQGRTCALYQSSRYRWRSMVGPTPPPMRPVNAPLNPSVRKFA